MSCAGEKTKRPPRTVELLGALRHDLLELRLASGRPPGDALVFPTTDGEPWREHDYRNWRRRQFQKLAPACGLSRRPYDLRHSFVSLLIQEGRLSIVEIAEQLGHSASMTLDTYSHVIAEFRGAGSVDPDEAIQAARAAVKRGEGIEPAPQMLPTKPDTTNGSSPGTTKPPTTRGLPTEPTAGLEPAPPHYERAPQASAACERLGGQLHIVVARRVVQVAHRAVQIAVAHPLLDATDARSSNRRRSEGVAQVVETQGWQTSRGLSLSVATP